MTKATKATKATKQFTDEEIRQRYSKRVKAFLKQVKKCLPDNLEMVESIPNFTVTDKTGTYHVEMATIRKKGVPKPDSFVADILPFGAINSPGEGLLEISGAFTQERLIYFRQNTLPLLEYQPGVFRVISQGIESDGWYWLDKMTNNRAILVTCEELFDLIEMVNSYPSESDFAEYEG